MRKAYSEARIRRAQLEYRKIPRTGPERCSVFSEQCSVFGVLFGIFFVFVWCLFCSALSVRTESCSVFGVLFGGSSRTLFCSVFCSVGADVLFGVLFGSFV